MAATGHLDAVTDRALGVVRADWVADYYRLPRRPYRDELPATPSNRTAVPQGRHVHLLMARGAACDSAPI